MPTQPEFEALQRETSSWWYVARKKLLRDAAAQALRDKREARILDFGGCADLHFEHLPAFRILNVDPSVALLAFQQIRGIRDLVCSAAEELAFCSNSFDALLAGDILQTLPDDLAALREWRRVLKDGATLCLTVPAYPSLWGEKDEARGHHRRYTATELRRKLNNAGFEVTRVSYLVATGFFPAVAERVAKTIFTRSISRQALAASSAWADAGMVFLLDCERALIRYINLPFGTRIICWARKPPVVTERITVPAWERQWARRPLPQSM
jgi:ubiquinone/menaquinone biosynthesis C-methylase UbiE